MRSAEFRYNYKIGDTVYVYGHEPVKIEAIGTSIFIGINSAGETSYPMHDDWIKVEPKRLPSQEIKALISSRIISFPPKQSELASALIAMIYEHSDATLKWLDQNWDKKVDK